MKFYIQLLTALAEVRKAERGATMAEYGLMLALIAVVCLTAVGLIGTNLNTTFNAIATAVGGAAN